MAFTFGEVNHGLTQAVRRVGRGPSESIGFSRHSEMEMEADDFDHDDVLECLRKGVAYGPEPVNGELRANVVHRGRHIRVVVGRLGHAADDWTRLQTLRVVTVMRTK